MRRLLRLLPAALLTLPLCASSETPASAIQPAGKIDFRRDVRPLLQQHCVSCHGPELQMSGLRLDRRADAMRGGSQADIGPGNAEGSRLYQRLVGTRFGIQMPPAGPMGAHDIDTIKQWIDEGAEWPDDVSGDAPVMVADPDAVRLSAAIRDGDRSAIDERLRATPRAATARSAHGTTLLMTAALYGDAALVQTLLAAGADPNAANSAGATALMWAAPDREKLRLLLDAGADVNARSEDRRSALVVASGIVGAAPAVKLLLDYGADPSAWYPTDPTALREAARADDVEIFRLLIDYGAEPKGAGAPTALFVRTNCATCAALVGLGGPLPRRPPDPGEGTGAPIYDPARAARPTPIGPTPVTAATVRAAVDRSLPLLQQIDVDFVRRTGCVSCHHNTLVAMAVSAARANGYAVNEAIATQQTAAVGMYLESWRERAAQNMFIAGQMDTISYLLLGLAVERYTPDAATDAQAMWLKRRQSADGHWPVQTVRPPIESNDIEVTAVSMRALQAFAPPSQRAEYARAVERARDWLDAARATATEERAFRLLGLSWAGADRAVVDRAARELLAGQREDGGWAQTEKMTTDAYATGEALVALRESGAVEPANPAYRKGLAFLLRTQFEDGTWFVETRAAPIQAYFESGFPYGVHQWISAAATGWATTALAMAKP
jgi:cytochrome c551/c552